MTGRTFGTLILTAMFLALPGAGLGPESAVAAPAASTAPAAPTALPATPSEASTGWRQEAQGWAYYDRAGRRAVNTWVKSGDRKTAYYLDERGLMVTDRLIPYEGGTGYVGETGAQVKNKWIAMTNDGLWDEPVAKIYYYFDSNGKAVRDGERKINGKTYFFDREGRMLSGWHEEDGEYYFLGTEDEGFMHTGWQLLTPLDTDESGFMDQWYYFHPKRGRAYRGKKKIGGSYYYFDEDTTAMQEGWLEWENQYTYYEPGTGRLVTGWAYCEGPEEDGDSEEYWYYLDKDGVPFNYGRKDAGEGDELGRALNYANAVHTSGVAARTLRGETYLFDENGRMLTGMYYLWEVRNTGGKTLGDWRYEEGQYLTGGTYFFDNQDGDSLGRMLKGGRKKVTVDGSEYYYCFDNRGKVYESYIVDGYLYGEGGEPVNAEDWDKYLIVDTNDIDVTHKTVRIKGSRRVLKDCRLLVDRKGKVKKNGKVTYDGYRYTVKNYAVVGVELID